jgi:hypothetical protein
MLLDVADLTPSVCWNRIVGEERQRPHEEGTIENHNFKQVLHQLQLLEIHEQSKPLLV